MQILYWHYLSRIDFNACHSIRFLKSKTTGIGFNTFTKQITFIIASRITIKSINTFFKEDVSINFLFSTINIRLDNTYLKIKMQWLPKQNNDQFSKQILFLS